MKDLNKVTLTERDKRHLFKFHEYADNLERIVSKCDAVTNIFEEALESMSNQDIRPCDNTTIIDVVKVIHDYSTQAKYGIRKLESDLSEFNTNIRDNGGVAI